MAILEPYSTTQEQPTRIQETNRQNTGSHPQPMNKEKAPDKSPFMKGQIVTVVVQRETSHSKRGKPAKLKLKIKKGNTSDKGILHQSYPYPESFKPNTEHQVIIIATVPNNFEFKPIEKIE